MQDWNFPHGDCFEFILEMSEKFSDESKCWIWRLLPPAWSTRASLRSTSNNGGVLKPMYTRIPPNCAATASYDRGKISRKQLPSAEELWQAIVFGTAGKQIIQLHWFCIWKERPQTSGVESALSCGSLARVIEKSVSFDLVPLFSFFPLPLILYVWIQTSLNQHKNLLL